MELSQLMYFREAARLEHITMAAERLHISQPALSRAIQGLEDELHVKLFDRSRGGLSLNEYGRVLLEHADRVAIELNVAEAKIREMSCRARNDIYIYYQPNVVTRQLVESYVLAHPEVSVHNEIVSDVELAGKLEKCRLDFAVCTNQMPAPGALLEWLPLYREGYCAVTSRAHPLASRGSVEMRCLKDERFIINNMHSGLANTIFRFCLEAGFSPKIAFEGQNTELMDSLVEKGFGVFLMADTLVARRSEADPRWAASRAFVRLTDAFCSRTIGILKLRGRELSPCAREMYSYLASSLTAPETLT